MPRSTRAIPALAVLVVTCVGQAGTVYAVTRSTVNAHNIDILDEKVKDLEKITKQASTFLNETIASIKVLDENDRRLADRISYIESSISNYPVVLSRFVFVSNYLEEVKGHLQEISKKLKEYRISSELLELTKNPLWNEPASKWSTLKECNVARTSDNSFRLTLNFIMPVLDQNIRILKARSFKFWNQTQPGKFCVTKYTGPRFVMTNVTNNCYDDVNTEDLNEEALLGFLCINHDQGLAKLKNTFSKQFCSSKPDYHDKEQVIQFGGENLIYCPGQTIKIRDKDYQCPEHVFALPIAESFSLNHYSFKASTRAEIIINTLEKQMNDDIRTSLNIDKVKIIGVNITMLETEYWKFGRLIDSVISRNITLKDFEIPEILKGPFGMIQQAFASVWEWLEKGIMVIMVIAGFMLATLSAPIIHVALAILRIAFRTLKGLLTRHRRSQVKYKPNSYLSETYVSLED